MSRQTTTHGRRLRLPAITRKQLRTRTHDLQGMLRHASQEAQRQEAEAARQLAGAEEFMHGQTLRIEELEQQVGQLQADAVDTGVLRRQLTVAVAAHERLLTEHLAVKSQLQDRDPVSVPPSVRDTTEPPPVTPVYEQVLRSFGHRPVSSDGETTQQMVMPLADSPMAGAR